MENSVDQAKGSGWSLDGIFRVISTHGLGVFLVVFYATAIHQESTKERGEWIQTLTRLERMIDSTHRPLDAHQAETVIRGAVDIYIPAIEREFERAMSDQAQDQYIDAAGGEDLVRLWKGTLDLSLLRSGGRAKFQEKLAAILDKERQRRESAALAALARSRSLAQQSVLGMLRLFQECDGKPLDQSWSEVTKSAQVQDEAIAASFARLSIHDSWPLKALTRRLESMKVDVELDASLGVLPANSKCVAGWMADLKTGICRAIEEKYSPSSKRPNT